MTIQEALQQIRTVVPRTERSINITVSIWEHHHIPDEPTILFSIWDEQGHHTGPTLEIAVGNCIAANTSGQIEDAEVAFVEAAAMAAV